MCSVFHVKKSKVLPVFIDFSWNIEISSVGNSWLEVLRMQVRKYFNKWHTSYLLTVLTLIHCDIGQCISIYFKLQILTNFWAIPVLFFLMKNLLFHPQNNTPEGKNIKSGRYKIVTNKYCVNIYQILKKLLKCSWIIFHLKAYR